MYKLCSQSLSNFDKWKPVNYKDLQLSSEPQSMEPWQIVRRSVVFCRAVNSAVQLILLCSAVQCSALQCSAVQCSAVQWSAVQCSTLQCSTVQCSTVQWVQCSAVQCSAEQCSAVQCSAVKCSGSKDCGLCTHRATAPDWICSQLNKRPVFRGGDSSGPSHAPLLKVQNWIL